MLRAVHAIHEERIVHSDLKPANFLFVRGALKLIDFGIAKAIQNDTTNIHREHQVGTVNYMSPEALTDTSKETNTAQCMKVRSYGGIGGDGWQLGRPSDVWSLGCILFQMVYGKTPFSHLAVLQKLQKITDPSYAIDYPAVESPFLVRSRLSGRLMTR
jgi:serine/threonine protein kinase